MNFEDMNLKELLEVGIKSEIEAEKKYEQLAEKEFFLYHLREELKKLARMEKQHEETLKRIFKKKFPNEEINLPDESFHTSLDELDLDRDITELGAMRKVLESAVKSEKESSEFYQHLANEFKDKDMKKIAKYLAHLEEGHEKSIKHELEYEIDYQLAQLHMREPGF